LNKASAGTCRARLSGLLIGSELAASRALWDGRPVKLVGEHKLAALYQKALAQAGGAAESLDSEITTLNGLRAAYRALEEQTS
jgi:2-dehydro-3-deoxygalactonokinase